MDGYNEPILARSKVASDLATPMNDTQHNHGVVGRVDVRRQDANADLRPKGGARRATVGMIRQAVI
jgi:hypothetical protein